MKKNILATLGVSLGIFSVFAFSHLSLAQADNTVLVTPPVMATSIADVLAKPQSWFFYNDENDTIDNGLGSFVSGPGTAPLGSGSVQISVTGTQRRNLATYQFSGQKLSDLTALRFSTYNPSVGNAGSVNRSAYLNFNIDLNGTDTWQGRLVYVPSANGSVTQDAWKEWDALNGGNALWTWSKFASNGNKWPDNNTSANRTWNDILTAFPNARIRVTDSWLGLRVGEPYADGYTENLDSFVLGTAAGTTRFDFDPYVAPTVPTITIPANGASVSSSALTMVDWSDSTGSYPAFQYQYEAFADAGYTNSLYLSGWLSASEIPTPGTAPGTYYLRVRAKDALGSQSAWSNDSGTPYSVTVTADAPSPTPTPTVSPTPTLSPSPTPTPVGPPTTKADCKNDGWKLFTNPKFKNQGKCIEYVEKHKHTIKGEVRYEALGVRRQAEFKMDTADNDGKFLYVDAQKNWYRVDVSAVQVNGHFGYFAGKVTKASNPAWVGQWIFAKVEDKFFSADRIWGSFTDEASALAGVAAHSDPADGPFSVQKGKIIVH